MADVDLVKELSQKYGLAPESSDVSALEGKAPEDRQKFIADLETQFKQRAAPTSSRQYDSQGPAYNQTTNQINPGFKFPAPAPVAAPYQFDMSRAATSQAPPFQFNDPYTKLFEDAAQKSLSSLQGNNAQMQQLMSHLNTQFQTLAQPTAAETQAQKYLESLQQVNPQVQQMMDFLNKQFQTLSQSQGYTPEELAILRTQAQEPIEADRKAAQQRALLRAGSRGVLPSSGIVLDEQNQIDHTFDAMRGTEGRNIALNSIQKRQQDLATAMGLGQVGIAIPQQQQQQALSVAQTMENARRQRVNDALNVAQLGVQIPDQREAQGLNVANMLYQLPRTAMQDANNIVNGSSPTAAMQPLIQLLQMGQQNSQFNQTMSAQQQQQLWGALGQLFDQIMHGGNG